VYMSVFMRNIEYLKVLSLGKCRRKNKKCIYIHIHI